jgi:hypothetical protein
MSEPTPEAVEAAAKASYEEANFGLPWGECRDEWRVNYRTVAHAALSAAAPYLIREAQAQALEEAAGAWSDWDALQAPEDWLRARAAAIRDGAQ